MLTEYFLVKNFNVPLGTDLDTISAWKSDCFVLIEQEINNIKEFKING